MAEALDSGDNLTPSDQDPDLTLARKLQLVPMLYNLLIIINASKLECLYKASIFYPNLKFVA